MRAKERRSSAAWWSLRSGIPEHGPSAADPTSTGLAWWDELELAIMRLSDEEMRAWEQNELKAKFLAGEMTGNARIDEIQKRVEMYERRRKGLE